MADGQTESMYHFRQAYIKEIAGDIDGAIEELEKATEGDVLPTVHLKLIELYQEKRLFEKALVKLNIMLSANPRSKDYRMLKIKTLKSMERFYEAYEEYEKILELFPNEPENYISEADFLIEGGKLEEALSRVRKAIELNPENPQFYINEAEILMEMERTEDAIKSVVKAISFAPCVPDYYSLAGKLLDGSKNYDEGEKYLIKASEMRPHELSIIQDLCEHFEKKEDLKSAIACYDRLIALNPYEASYFFERGTLNEELNNISAAIEDYTKASNLDPTNRQYSDRVNRLRNSGA